MFSFILASIWVLVKGAGIGLAVAAPVGPIGMLCIRTTLERGRIAGFCAGLGAAVADTIFAGVGAYGLSLIGSFIAAEQSWFKLCGGAFLIAFGLYLATRPAKVTVDSREVPQGLLADFALTLVLTLANPTTILTFAAIFAGLSGLRGFDLDTIPVLLLGVFAGSAGWWLFLSGAVGMVRHMIDARAMLWINRLAGIALVGYGVVTLIEPVQALAAPLVAELMAR